MKTLTDIICIIDRSGSMQAIKSDAIGGFNQFLESQKKEEGDARLTLVLFNDGYQLLYEAIPLPEVVPLNSDTFVPMGTTALYDAVGKTINTVGVHLNQTPESERPNKVLFVILTDGLENASKEFTNRMIADMIAHQRERYNWEFLFLAANQDAILTAESMNIARGNALDFEANSQGVQTVYDKMTMASSRFRQMDDKQDSSTLFDEKQT